MLNIISVGLGIVIFIYSITLFWRTYNLSTVKSHHSWWIILVIFIFFFLVGYVLFEYFLLTGKELFDFELVVSQVFLWGSVFVLICARLFYMTTKEQIKQKNELMKTTFESLPYPFYVINAKDYTIAMANSVAYKGDLAEGLTCYALTHKGSKPCGSKEHQCPLDEMKETRKPAIVEHVHYDKDGNTRNVEVHCYPIFDNRGNVVQAIEYSLDITERKKAEEICLENDRLMLASKAKSEFLTNMSHELRTPLNSIIGFSELLKQKTHGVLNEKQVRYVENVLTGGNNLLRLINDILDLSRVEAGNIDLEIEKVSVQAVMDESLNLIKEKAANHNVTLKKELDSQLDFIEADKQRIKQVLYNLLSNAIKFSKPEGGTVTITTRKEGDMAKISVSDTGIGIKEEEKGKLFKEFEQLDSGTTRKYGGTGLGLVISKKLVELHGGKIWAESSYGEGTTFTFTLLIAGEIK